MDSKILTLLYKPQKLDKDTLEQVARHFQVVKADPKELKKFYNEMYKFFSTDFSTCAERMKLYYGSYWDWYVRATWILSLSLSQEDLLFHIKMQLPTAFRLVLSVEELLLYYLYRRCITEDDIQSFFEKIRIGIQQSTVSINPLSTRVITIVDIIKELEKNSIIDNDSIKSAAFIGEIETQLFFSLGDSLTSSEKTDYTRAFIEFIKFLSGKETNILTTMEYYIDGLDEEDDEDLQRDYMSNFSDDVVDANSLKSTYAKVKESVDSRFPKDDQGQYIDIEGVFALLGELATEYEDPRIQTLLYFDEKTGGFAWVDEDSLLGDMDQNLDPEVQ